MNYIKLVKRWLISIHNLESVWNYIYEHKFGHNLRDGVSPFSGFGLKEKLYGLSLWMGFNCLKCFMVPLYWCGSTVSRLQRAFTGRQFTYFLPLSPQDVLVLIWSTSEGWKAELPLEPTSGFEPGTPGSGIQCPNH